MNRANQLIQLHMVVCCATQLVASTVVCCSEGTAEILFKLCGVWTECWTDYSGLERAECIMWVMWTECWTDYSGLERAQILMCLIKSRKP